jgi:molybdopterin biosynthesis enzyme
VVRYRAGQAGGIRATRESRIDAGLLPALRAAGPVAGLWPDRPRRGNGAAGGSGHIQDGAIVATPVPTNTSGDFASLGGTDGYVELSRVQSEFPAGSVVPLHRWNQP